MNKLKNFIKSKLGIAVSIAIASGAGGYAVVPDKYNALFIAASNLIQAEESE